MKLISLRIAFLMLFMFQFSTFSKSIKNNVVFFEDIQGRKLVTRIDHVKLFVVSEGQPKDDVYGTDAVMGKRPWQCQYDNEINIRSGRHKTYDVYNQVLIYYEKNVSAFFLSNFNPDLINELNFFTSLDLHFYPYNPLPDHNPPYINFVGVICKNISVAQTSFKDHNYWGLYYSSKDLVDFNKISCYGK